MSFTSTSTEPASTSLFDKLPPEVMRLIAEQAYYHDEAYRERTNRHKWSTARDTVFKAAKTIRGGCSLNTLFLTSRAWHAAVTPYLFMHLDTQDCKNVLFRRCILPKFAEFAQIVSFRCEDGYPEDNVEELVISLPFFRHLRRLEMAFCTVDELLKIDPYGISKPPTKDLLVCRQEFRNAVVNVTDVKLIDFEPSSLVWMLDSFPKLRRLHLDGFRCFEEEDPTAEEKARPLIEQAVAKLPALTHLSIDDEQDSFNEDKAPIGFGDGWRAEGLAWGFRTSLRSLRIARHGLDWDTNLWSFVQHFAETLESLEVGVLRSSPETEEASSWPRSKDDNPAAAPFLNLGCLCVVGSGQLSTSILEALATAPLRHLRLPLILPHLEIDQHADITPLFSTALSLYPTSLRSIVTSSRNPYASYFDEGLKWALAHRCECSKVAFRVEGDCDVWSQRTTKRRMLKPASMHDVGVRCDGIEQAANFALNYAGRARAMGDVYAAEMLMALLEPVRSLMMQEEL